MQTITTIAELEAIYGIANLASTGKVADHVTDAYGRIIEAAPFCALATVGPFFEGQIALRP